MNDIRIVNLNNSGVFVAFGGFDNSELNGIKSSFLKALFEFTEERTSRICSRCLTKFRNAAFR